MSRLGEAHKALMRQIEAGFFHVISAEALLEHDAEREELASSLEMARTFLLKAQKLAIWIDGGGAFEPAAATEEQSEPSPRSERNQG